MIEADLARIEAELGVLLPEVYRSVVLEYPIPACVGNDDTELWADRCHLPEWTPSSKPIPFGEWCQDYVAGLRSDLDGDGINPDGTPDEARRQMDLDNRSSDRASCGCVLFLLLLLAVAIGFRIRDKVHGSLSGLEGKAIGMTSTESHDGTT